VRDRLLTLNGSAGQVRPVRIKREDCDVEMLCLKDFELENEDDVRARKDARDCVEKAMLCWCTNDGMVSNFSAKYLPRPAVAPHLPPRSIFIPQCAPSENFDESEQALYTSSTTFDVQPSFFEDASVTDIDNEYTIATSAAPSIHEDCVTLDEKEQEPDQNVVFSRPLGAGFGVDGEYDDYLELLCPIVECNPEKWKGKEREGENRSTWAFQLNCENGRVLSV
jgi:hypothetical protein